MYLFIPQKGQGVVQRSEQDGKGESASLGVLIQTFVAVSVWILPPLSSTSDSGEFIPFLEKGVELKKQFYLS